MNSTLGSVVPLAMFKQCNVPLYGAGEFKFEFLRIRFARFCCNLLGQAFRIMGVSALIPRDCLFENRILICCRRLVENGK